MRFVDAISLMAPSIEVLGNTGAKSQDPNCEGEILTSTLDFKFQ